MGKIKLLNLETITKEHAIELLSYEQELRYSDKYQQMYKDNMLGDKRHGIIVEDVIQLDVLSHFNYTSNEQNLKNLRNMFDMFRNDPDVSKHAFWINMNIMHSGVSIGSKMKNCTFVDLNKNNLMLDDIVKNKTIIMAGSIT